MLVLKSSSNDRQSSQGVANLSYLVRNTDHYDVAKWEHFLRHWSLCGELTGHQLCFIAAVTPLLPSHTIFSQPTLSTSRGNTSGHTFGHIHMGLHHTRAFVNFWWNAGRGVVVHTVICHVSQVIGSWKIYNYLKRKIIFNLALLICIFKSFLW